MTGVEHPPGPINICPACGPVPPWATSNYCRHHAAELWQSYLRMRDARRVDAAGPAA
jgi:hypothetical protein